MKLLPIHLSRAGWGTRLILTAILALSQVSASCEKKPYVVLRGNPVKTGVVTGTEFEASGFRIAYAPKCFSLVTTHWCPLSSGGCKEVAKEDVSCPSGVPEPEVSILSPWGQTYAGRANMVPVAWEAIEIDPLAANARALVRGAWRVSTADGDPVPFDLSDVDADRMLALIGEARDRLEGAQDGASPHKPTVLALRFVETSEPNQISIEVQNRGGVAARDVVVRLRSGFTPLHGSQAKFGRIGTKLGKTWRTEISYASVGDDLTPMVIADLTASNAQPLTVSRRVKLRKTPPPRVPPPPSRYLKEVTMRCRATVSAVAFGGKVHVACSLVNEGKEQVTNLSYRLELASGEFGPMSGPPQLSPHGGTEISGELAVPRTAKVGEKLVATVRIQRAGESVSSAPISIPVVSMPCPDGVLTNAQYQEKRKRYQAALAAGSLTQAEVDKYEADLIKCLR